MKKKDIFTIQTVKIIYMISTFRIKIKNFHFHLLNWVEKHICERERNSPGPGLFRSRVFFFRKRDISHLNFLKFKISLMGP